MIYIDAKCRKCGSYIQLIYNPDIDRISRIECSCGNKMEHVQYELLRNCLDHLESMNTRLPFKLNQAIFR